jgi:hypothetical protein
MVNFEDIAASQVSNLTHAIRVSIEHSTGSVDRDFRKGSSPGVSGNVEGAIAASRLLEELYCRQ